MDRRSFIGTLAGLTAPQSTWGGIHVENTSFFGLYQRNRSAGIPNFITEDYLLLSYSMLLENAITEFEQTISAMAYANLLEALSAPDAADLHSVLRSLLSGKKWLAEGAKPETVRGELARVQSAEKIERSELARQQLDYSQFRVRGKYAASPELSRYFQALRYGSAILFPARASQATGISGEDADALARQALALRSGLQAPKAAALYASMEGALAWLFGPADDLTLADLSKIPQGASPKAFRDAMAVSPRRPSILSVPMDVSLLEAGVTPTDAAQGWRLFPQRFSAESAAMQRLVYPEAGEYLGSAPPPTAGMIAGKLRKAFPSSFEIMSLLGSASAGEWLTEKDARNFAGYDAAAKRASLDLARGTGLGQDHLNLIRQWVSPKSPDSRTRLNSMLGFWTYQRYNGVLYNKESLTPIAKSMPLDRDTAWLAPAAPLYRELARLATQASTRLRNKPLAQFAVLAERSAALSVGGSAAKTGQDADFLNQLDDSLAALIGREDGPIVVSLHTDMNTNQVLHVGLGGSVEVAPRAELNARGARFSHYELTVPLEQRLTDKEWKRALSGAKGLQSVPISSTGWKSPEMVQYRSPR